MSMFIRSLYLASYGRIYEVEQQPLLASVYIARRVIKKKTIWHWATR